MSALGTVSPVHDSERPFEVLNAVGWEGDPPLRPAPALLVLFTPTATPAAASPPALRASHMTSCERSLHLENVFLLIL